MALKESMSRFDVSASYMLMAFSVTDTAYGTMAFRISDASFVATNVTGGPMASPAVVSWGSFRKFLPIEGKGRQSPASVVLDADCVLIPTDGNTRITVATLLREVNLRDVAVTVYQWNSEVTTFDVVWFGYITGITDSVTVHGKSTITLGMVDSRRAVTTPISDIVVKDVFANAPSESLGKMVPRAYGNWRETFDALDDVRPILFGLPCNASPGVLIDDSTVVSTAPYNTFRFLKMDGTSTAEDIDAFLQSSTVLGGDYLMYIEETDTYAQLVDHSPSSSSSSVQTDAKKTGLIWLPLRLSEEGPLTTVGYEDELYKCINENTDDFVTLAKDDELAWRMPQRMIPTGCTVSSAKILVDARNENIDGKIRFGIWNNQESGGANWLGASKSQLFQTVNFPTTRARYFTTTANEYDANDCKTHVGSYDTDKEFSRGEFFGADSGNNFDPLQVAVWNVATIGTPNIYIYNVALLLKVRMPHRWVYRQGGKEYTQEDIPSLYWRKRFYQFATLEPVAGLAERSIYAITGKFQKDDGSGTYTGTANQRINKASEIVHHLLHKIGGESVNTTSGTLGNFTDSRTENVADESHIECSFGPEVTSYLEAKDHISSEYPVITYQEDGTWRIVKDEMNPHSSQMYRSSSDPVMIEAFDIVDGSLAVEEDSIRDIVNRVTLNYGYSASVGGYKHQLRYDHPLSQDRFGVLPEITVNSKYVHRRSLDTVPAAATYLSKYHGRKSARPRLRVKLSLTQKFYDLKRGHVLTFGDSMESAGYTCPAYRCGRLDYQYFRGDSSPANQADDTTPTYLPAGNLTNETYFVASQQYPSLTFELGSTAGVYSTVANGWEYHDGASWTVLSNVKRDDGGDPLEVFKLTSQTRIVSWDWPTLTTWKKSELTIASAARGPGYAVRMKYSTSSVATSGTSVTRIPAKWRGRVFVVEEATRKPGRYSPMEVVLREVM